MPGTTTPQATAPATPAPTSDPAEQILRSAQGVDTNTQAAAWDAFHQSKNEDELTQRLQNINIPQNVKANLWDAKRLAAPKVQPGAPLTESEAANYAINQSRAAVPPMETSTLGSVHHSLVEGNETSADPRAHAAAEYGKRVQQGLDAADRGEITSAGIGVGAMKGVAEGVHTLGAVGSHATNAFAPDPSLSDLVAGRKPTLVPNVPFQEPKSLEAGNTSETVGKIGENVLEFMTGDEALKSLGLSAKLSKLKKVAEFIEEYPRLAKAMHIGANAMRQGTVGGAQTLVHGGTPGEALATGVVTGGTGLALEGAGQGVKAIKNFVTRGPQVEQLGRELVSGLTAGATPEQVARTVGKNLADAEETMHSTYDAGMKSISAQGKSVPVSLAGSPLQQTAKQLLTDSNVPESVATSLKGVIPDSAKIEPFLKQISESTETLTWDQAEATRQKIGETIRKLPWDSPIRPDLIKVRYAIDDTLEQSAEKAGNTNLSDQIKSLRSDYAQTKGALEERAIVSLKDKNPNAIADVLLNKQSVHDVNTLRRLIGPENMKVVEGSILDKMIQDASKNGELQGRQLFRKFNSLGPDAKQAIWGDRLPQVQQFMQEAGRLPNVVLDKIVSHYAPYALGTIAAGAIGHGDIKTAATIGGAAMLSALLRNPIVLDAALKGIQGLQKVAPAAAATGTQAIEKDGEDEDVKPDNDAGVASNLGTDIQAAKSADQDMSGWRHIQTSDKKHHLIHPEDLTEAQRRDPNLIIHDQPQ